MAESLATSTAQVVMTSVTASVSAAAANATTNHTASAIVKEAVLFPLRLISRSDRFLFHTLPRAVFQATGLTGLSQRVADSFAAAAGGPAAEGLAGAAGEAAMAQNDGSWSNLLVELFSAGTTKSYLGMFHYVTSRWAFTCFLMALVLNRVQVYGSTRARILLTWNKRLALRLIPIILFVSQMHQILQAIHCQSSPDFSLYRHGDNNKYNILDWSSDGGVLHQVSSKILFMSTDEQSCAALGMSRPEPDVRAPKGSFSLLWPTFLRLSVSHLIENLSCALQQTPVMTEVGLSVFEHSLAFAEAETMILHTIRVNSQRKAAKAAQTATTTTTVTTTVTDADAASASASSLSEEATVPASGTILAITDAIHSFYGSHPFDRINVPMEVLLVALLSCGNALSAHVISVLGKKHKWRLANTGFWGICYISAFTWGFFRQSEMVRVDDWQAGGVSGLLHFPTVAIVGFIPHIAIVLGIVVCCLIYVVALLMTAISLGTNPGIRQPTSLKERFSIAHDNLQAAIQLKRVTLRYYEDFYTALLRIGFAALTAASEAVFLNEGRAVEMRQFTWLEEERLDELDASRPIQQSEESHYQIVEQYGIPGQLPPNNDRSEGWKSGYDKERKLEKKDKSAEQKDGSFIYPNPRADGVGALQRTTRFYLLLIFIRGIIFTIGGWLAFAVGKTLDRLGITARPPWLRRIIGASLKQVASDRERSRLLEENNKFDTWAANGGIGSSSRDADVDIEHTMRNNIATEDHDDPQAVLDERMYDWWKKGGWYGTIDESGEYLPMPSVEQDDDATSVITTTTATTTATNDEDGWASEPEGTRTPTRDTNSWSFSGLRHRSVTPSVEPPLLDSAALARLLDPRDAAAREEARMLALHLTSNGITTRSKYRSQFEKAQTQVLLAGKSTSRALTGEDEAQALEQLLIARRVQKGRTPNSNHPPAFSDSHTNRDGPACVVCQTEPRTIIAWPCRCLTVCEECRVNLAMNNFGNCVTCRRQVGGFVRLYVP